MQFGFAKPPTYNRFRLTTALIILGLLIVFLFLFKFIGLVRNSVFAGNRNVIIESLETLSITLAGLDSRRARLGVSVDKILQQGASTISYDEFMNLFDALGDEGLQRLLPEEYQSIVPLLQEVSNFGDDLYSLLGYESEQSYLVVLQNTNESRPNGGFFGSFALVKFHQGTLSYVEIIDSYLPNFDRPNTYITGPEWFYNFLPNRQIHFIGANKVGFTYHDGANIKALYEKSYPGQKIRGVMFLTTDMFTNFLDDFDDQIREWQFANAAVDIIRGESRRGKKEHYLQGSQEYFEANKTKIIQGLAINFDEILQTQQVNAYLTDISGPFHGFLRRNNLTTRFEAETAYIRESNLSFNKIDNFIKKTTWCFDVTGNSIVEIDDSDIFSLLPFDQGAYTCKISYTLAVPDSHFARIGRFENEYEVVLTERERHILGVIPNRDSRTIIHLPQHYTITSITGDRYEQEIFATPFSSAAMFKTYISENDSTAHIYVSFLIE